MQDLTPGTAWRVRRPSWPTDQRCRQRRKDSRSARENQSQSQFSPARPADFLARSIACWNRTGEMNEKAPPSVRKGGADFLISIGKRWSGREDLNLRPPAPEASVLREGGAIRGCLSSSFQNTSGLPRSKRQGNCHARGSRGPSSKRNKETTSPSPRPENSNIPGWEKETGRHGCSAEANLQTLVI